MTPAPAEGLTDLHLPLHSNRYSPVPLLAPHVATEGVVRWLEALCPTTDEATFIRWTDAQHNCSRNADMSGVVHRCGKITGSLAQALLGEPHADPCETSDAFFGRSASSGGAEPEL